MNDIEKTIRYKIAETLANLAELIIRREPPFDRTPLQCEIIPYCYQKYLEYVDEIEQPLKERILRREIDHVRWLIQSEILGFSGPFIKKYPQHIETDKAFRDWITQKEGPRSSVIEKPPPSSSDKINVNQIVKRVMKERKPDFLYNKKMGSHGVISFSKPWLHNNKVYIIVDKGTKRQFIDFLIGIEYPKFFIDIANFFSNSQSMYNYESSEEVFEVVNRALDLIEMILPHFIDRVKEVLS